MSHPVVPSCTAAGQDTDIRVSLASLGMESCTNNKPCVAGNPEECLHLLQPGGIKLDDCGEQKSPLTSEAAPSSVHTSFAAPSTACNH